MFNFDKQEEVLSLLAEYKGRIFGLLSGLFFAILILTVGLISAVFILMLMGIGYYLGYRYDNKQSIQALLDEILPPEE